MKGTTNKTETKERGNRKNSREVEESGLRE